MTYELAKELKDAGFPQNQDSDEYIYDDKNDLDEAYSPTLSELINACVDVAEDGDFHLEHLMQGDNKNWGAATCWKPVGKDEWFFGATPEEAVARLWLAINKKKHE